MEILLLNPPHKSIGSRLPREHLPPLGLLSVGGPLIDAGYRVRLLDADYDNLRHDEILRRIDSINPELILMGHSGSTSAQPIINDLSKLIKSTNPQMKIIVGGVFPTFHWEEILRDNPQIDFIICGEGERTALDLVKAIQQKTNYKDVDGIAYASNSDIIKTPQHELITDLDDYRIGWELMSGYNYTYWGKKRAVVIQFSRGCPYPCTFCGQSIFWNKWRHRDPQILADEIEMLHKQYKIEVINFADENPSSNREPWIAFLKALADKDLNIILVGSIRADNIVRDADYLHLYKRVGFERFLLGIEGYDKSTLDRLQKSGSTSKDRQAIQLLRKHDILSMATYVVGLGEEKTHDFFNSLRQLISYDPDQVQLLYATPHKWTPYYDEVKEKNIVQPDQTKWDYKHQVMELKHIRPWRVILYVKLIEVLMQTRPRAISRWLFHRDKRLRQAMHWYNGIGKRVWIYEIFEFIFSKNKNSEKMKLHEFWK